MTETHWYIYFALGFLPAISATVQAVDAAAELEPYAKRGQAGGIVFVFFLALVFWPLWVIKEVLKRLMKKYD